MNDYEFWDELGKIFNAVVAYQAKSVEFNKRFINPWIRLGNVFDKRDRNKEALASYEKAIELDPGNAQNWYELGNIHFRAENFDAAVEAYNKAIELAAESGWSYNNLALTFMTQGRYAEAIPLYQKSIELLQADKDKAVAWNRLGNVYRKLNEYELAIQAFQKADELDPENGGFRDDMDEISEGPSLVEGNQAEAASQPTAVSADPMDLVRAQMRAGEAESPAGVEAQDRATEPAGKSQESTPQIATAAQQTKTVPQNAVQASTDPVAPEEVAANAVEAPVVGITDEAPATSVELPAAEPAVSSTSTEQTVTVMIQNTVETYTDALAVLDTATETSDMALTAEDGDVDAGNAEGESTDAAEEPEDLPVDEDSSAAETGDEQAPAGMETAVFHEIITSDDEVVEEPQPERDDLARSDHVAYEEYLKDNNEPIDIFKAGAAEQAVESQDEPAAREPVAQIDPSGELKIEVDTKNAHVWNELGNVYYNTGAFDDAVVAYSKAIELDRWFAWPYSNLALTYVQKGRFVEAILLYQRSIELFLSEKDKAISWNRLGNVYRRLNDYDNAIAAYQRADDMDPDNASLSLQSRFSLLGSFHAEQKPTYVS
jgi:tetratricopeptide (TPR) repeat protein